MSITIKHLDGPLKGRVQPFDNAVDKIMLVPVGRAEIVLAAEEGERQAIRSRPSLPIYTAERARAGKVEALAGPSVAKI